MQLTFNAIAEDRPGALWQAHAQALWPSYHRWWLHDGDRARPSYTVSRKALRTHMPELEPVWRELTDSQGGGDAVSRFLAMWCPPPYITGCSQAVWLGDEKNPSEARLLRNYDFAPALFEGAWLATRWTGQRVMAMSDCLWGALDGVNESGLAVSLSFGGRTVHGEGFGIPLVMRYLLEVAEDVDQAVALLKRLPHHMSYSITLLDKHGKWATVFVAPDRPTEVVDKRSVSNIQHAVEWPDHDRATRATERALSLAEALASSPDSTMLAARMMHPPIAQAAFERGYGTLYTAVYAPALGVATLSWPEQPSWSQSLESFTPGCRDVGMASEFLP